ncbi:MAG: tetratricopeptide repeat protein [Acidobacteriota bacterium]
MCLCGSIFLACAHPPPAQPSSRAIVDADIRRAEDAELHRRHDLARQGYERAIADAKEPETQRYARREFAETLEQWGEIAEAIAQLEAAVAAVPADAASWNDLGVLYYQQGDTGRALAALERAKALAPRDWRPRRQLAAVLVATHDYTRATAEYRAMLDLELPDRLRAAVKKALELLAASTPSS